EANRFIVPRLNKGFIGMLHPMIRVSFRRPSLKINVLSLSSKGYRYLQIGLSDFGSMRVQSPFTLALPFAIVLPTFTCPGRFSKKNTRRMHRPQSRWAVLSIAPSQPRVLSPYLS